MAKMKALLKSSISAAKGGYPLFYAFDDEISTGSFTSPIETDGCSESVAAYKKYQEERFGSVKYSRPSSFEDVRPALSTKNLSKWDLAKWMTWRSYMDNYFADVLLELTKYANSVDPSTPAGFVGSHNPSPYGGMDYTKFTKSIECIEAYDINGTNEILRSFFGKEKERVVTWFNGKGDPDAGSWYLWYYMVHGVRGVIAWPEGWFKGQAAPWLVKIKDSIKDVVEYSKPILDVKTEFDADPIGIYYSQASIQAGWAMDSVVHGNTWPNRSSSMDNDGSTGGRNRVAWFKLLEDAGYQYNVVSYENLIADDFSKKYKVLILPRVLCLSDKEAEEMKKFVSNGGVLIADYMAGIFTENGEGRKTGALDELFNVKRDDSKGYFDGKTVTEVNGELYDKDFLKRLCYSGAIKWSDIAVPERGTASIKGGDSKFKVAGAEVVIKNTEGSGKTYYLNLTPVEYTALSRRTSMYGGTWRKLLTGIMEENGLKPRVEIKKTGEGEFLLSESIFWKKGDVYYLCVVKNPGNYGGDITSGKGKLEGLDSRVKECSIDLTFKSELKSMKNLRTGKDLGAGVKFTDKWRTHEANIYELEFK